MPEASALRDKWEGTWALVGRQAPADLLEAVCARYSEAHRAYHTLEHVVACLDHAAAVRDQLELPGVVELSLWYHDAVYDPHRGDNEERSAELAGEHLLSFSTSLLRAVTELILVTKHPSNPRNSDAQFVVDIDLSILGAPTPVFDAYETAIRTEYSWVPEPLYRGKRREILQSFLDTARIYRTVHFAALESQARLNLARSIAALSP